MNRYKKVILTILSGILILLAGGVNALNIKEKTARPGEYLSQFAAQNNIDANHTLIILDIDDTIITSPPGQWLGRSVMFYGLMQDAIKQYPDWPQQQVAEYLDPLLVAIYQRTPLDLTDPSLPQVINQLRVQGFQVIGMTSRGLLTKEATLWQLHQAGIIFSETGLPKTISLSDNRSFVIESGVAFVSHGNRKGEVLQAIVKDTEIALPDINHVVMIDDQERHLTNVAQTLTGQNYTPVLCTYPATQKPYNHREAIQQLQHFLKQWESDIVMKNMMLNDPFTQSVMASSRQ